MLRWITKLFSQPEVPLDYVIGDYQPAKLNRLRKDFVLDQDEAELTELNLRLDKPTQDIENLYQHQ